MSKKIDTYAGTPADTYIESELPANDLFGQNGYRGPSSVVPGAQAPKPNDFAPKESPAHKVIKDAGMDFSQTRKIDPHLAAPIAHGMRDVNKNPVNVPPSGRPVTTQEAKSEKRPGKTFAERNDSFAGRHH